MVIHLCSFFSAERISVAFFFVLICHKQSFRTWQLDRLSPTLQPARATTIVPVGRNDVTVFISPLLSTAIITNVNPTACSVVREDDGDDCNGNTPRRLILRRVKGIALFLLFIELHKCGRL